MRNGASTSTSRASLGGCLEPSVRLKTRVRGYQLSRGGNWAASVALSVDVSTLCVLPSWGDQLTGLFVTADPLGYVDGPSMYAFAGFDPVNNGDPLGLYKGRPCERSATPSCERTSEGQQDREMARILLAECGADCDLFARLQRWLGGAGEVCAEQNYTKTAAAFYFIQTQLPESQSGAVIEATISACGGKAFKEIVQAGGSALARKLARRAEVVDEFADADGALVRRSVDDLGDESGFMNEATPSQAGMTGGDEAAPVHHLATNKNFKSSARGGPWSPRFESIFNRAGMDLDDAFNKVRVPGHQGPHPEAYHQAVYDRLVEATRGLDGATYRSALEEELTAIGTEAAKDGTLLNVLLTNG